MQPFHIPSWQSFPSDDEIVAAILGDGGAPQDRKHVERAMREYVLPLLREQAHGDLETLRWWLKDLERQYRSQNDRGPADRLVELAVEVELGEVREASMIAAENRLHGDLWPNEPYPDGWVQSPPTSRADLEARIGALEDRLDRLEQVYLARVRGYGRELDLSRNNLDVARDGTYDVTNGPVWEVLFRRNVQTRRHPLDAPY